MKSIDSLISGMSYKKDSFRKFVWEKAKSRGVTYIGGLLDCILRYADQHPSFCAAIEVWLFG